MHYMLLNYTKPSELATVDSVATAAEGELSEAYTKALVDAGVLVRGEELHPSFTSTTLRLVDGAQDLLDGPYADTKEQFGGFYIINVPHLDDALLWASRSPAAANGAVEVRPVLNHR